MDRSRVAWTDPRYPRGGRSSRFRPGLRPRGGAAHSARDRSSIDCPSSWVPSSGWQPTAMRLGGRPSISSRSSRRPWTPCRLETESRPAVVVSSGQIMADIDPAQLRTAVVNLVRNAIAYSGIGRTGRRVGRAPKGIGDDRRPRSGAGSRPFRSGADLRAVRSWIERSRDRMGVRVGLVSHAARRRRAWGLGACGHRQMEDPRSESSCLGDGGEASIGVLIVDDQHAVRGGRPDGPGSERHRSGPRREHGRRSDPGRS